MCMCPRTNLFNSTEVQFRPGHLSCFVHKELYIGSLQRHERFIKQLAFRSIGNDGEEFRVIYFKDLDGIEYKK